MKLTKQGHVLEISPDRPDCLNSFGVVFRRRLERLGHLIDIDKSISALEYAVYLTSDDHLLMPVRLDNLAISYARRFQHLGDLSDLDKSNLVLEDARRLTSKTHSDT